MPSTQRLSTLNKQFPVVAFRLSFRLPLKQDGRMLLVVRKWNDFWHPIG
jgi:hypothetical protein